MVSCCSKAIRRPGRAIPKELPVPYGTRSSTITNRSRSISSNTAYLSTRPQKYFCLDRVTRHGGVHLGGLVQMIDPPAHGRSPSVPTTKVLKSWGSAVSSERRALALVTRYRPWFHSGGDNTTSVTWRCDGDLKVHCGMPQSEYVSGACRMSPSEFWTHVQMSPP